MAFGPGEDRRQIQPRGRPCRFAPPVEQRDERRQDQERRQHHEHDPRAGEQAELPQPGETRRQEGVERADGRDGAQHDGRSGAHRHHFESLLGG